MKVFMKSRLEEKQLQARASIGCDGIELQLLDELFPVPSENSTVPLDIEDVFDLSLCEKYNICAIHAPLAGEYSFNLEDLMSPDGLHFLKQTFKLANYSAIAHNKAIPVIVHSEMSFKQYNTLHMVRVKILKTLDTLLTMYPHTQLLIKNVSPIKEGKDTFSLRDNILYENVKLANSVNKSLETNRIGTVLDVCHAEMSRYYLDYVSKGYGKINIDYDIETFFKKNKETVQLIHLNSFTGNGYGVGHGIGFSPDNSSDMERLDYLFGLYEKHNYTCPITLEIRDTDYITCPELRKTKKAVDQILKQRKL